METSSKRHTLDQPQVEKARIFIETSTIVGADEMTAQDIACHEYLLACARKQGIAKDRHKITLAQLSDYLGVTSHERVWGSLERLMRTLVRYHINDPKKNRRMCKPLLEAVSTSTNRMTGTTIVTYSIPAIIRDAILQSRSYTWLDINSFAKFKCKYSGRLYPKLALMAGYDHRVRLPWEPTIQELAEFIGYGEKGAPIHYTSFTRILDKALAEIEEHIDRFSVTCIKPKRGKGKGRPVPEGAKFYFQTSDTAKSLMSSRPAVLSPNAIGYIENRVLSPLEDNQHPDIKLFAIAQTYTGIEAERLSDRWRMNVAHAMLYPTKRMGMMTGSYLTNVLNGEGVKQAFKLWVMMVVMCKTELEDAPVVTDDTPRWSPGAVGGTWIGE